MELIQAITDQISDDEVRRRHLESLVGQHTIHYVAHESGADIGLLSVDPIPGYDDFIVYEIFVPVCLRREGIGSRILRAAEQMGKELGYESILLSAKTMSDEFTQNDLEAWYTRRGYVLEPDSNNAFIKRLTEAK